MMLLHCFNSGCKAAHPQMQTADTVFHHTAMQAVQSVHAITGDRGETADRSPQGRRLDVAGRQALLHRQAADRISNADACDAGDRHDVAGAGGGQLC